MVYYKVFVLYFVKMEIVMSDTKPQQSNAGELLTAILKEEREQTRLLKPVHWAARAFQFLLIGAIVLLVIGIVARIALGALIL